MKKVLWVKFGWSDYYRGGPVNGNFHFRGRNKRWGEAFNFLPVNGRYYLNTPPHGATRSAPWNEDSDGWRVICLSKHPNQTGIHVVGWLEDATLHGEWLRRPTTGFSSGGYTISSDSAFLVPPEQRTRPFSHKSVGTAKYSFLAGPDIDTTDSKLELLNLLEAKVHALRRIAVHDPSEENLPDPELDPADPLKGFGTPEHRKKVEQAAEREVIALYEKRGCRYERCTHLPCGYDFLFSKRGSELHVEIKGTSGETAGFFLTRNEHARGMESNPKWRLAMVTHALSENPKVSVFDADQLRKAFELTPYVFLGRPFITPERA